MTRMEARRRAHEVAVRTGNRAFVYRDVGDHKEEVRVWPNGEVTYVKCDAHGTAARPPRTAWTRQGGLKANLRRPNPVATVTAAGFVALLLERII